MGLDPYWTDARNLLAAEMFRGRSILLPVAEWELQDNILVTYDSQASVDISAVDLVVVHKALVGAVSISDLRQLLSSWTIVFANEVFVVFSRQAVKVDRISKDHIKPLKIHVDPRQFWRENNPRPCAFLHIPKTAGTSIWSQISAIAPSSIYFAADEALLNFDGDLNDYELVGGHFLYRTLRSKGWKGPVFTTLRNPIDRLLSFMRHAIRDRGISGVLDQSHREIVDFVDSGMKADSHFLLQSRMNEQAQILGSAGEEDLDDPCVQLRAAARALERLESGEIEFALVEDEADMIAGLARCFAFETTKLPRANTTQTNFDESALRQSLTRSILDDSLTCNDIGLYQAARMLKSSVALPLNSA